MHPVALSQSHGQGKAVHLTAACSVAAHLLCCADVKLRIGLQSVLARTKPQWLLFYQVQQSQSGWYELTDVMTIEPDWLLEAAPHMYQYQHKQQQR